MPDSNKGLKPDGTTSNDAFESLRMRAEHITGSDEFDKSLASTNTVDGTDDDGGDQKVVDKIESLCMNCYENGTTRLLLTRIPFFREIIIMSFECLHCNFKNSEVQSAGEIKQKGTRYELRLTSSSDFSRQVVKSDTCIVKIIELDVEIPAGRGRLTNVEGLLTMILEDLELGQSVRKEQSPEIFVKIEGILANGQKMLAGESFPFRVFLDDPAGNSWIELDRKDGVGKLSKVEYDRTPEQNEALGLAPITDSEELPAHPVDDVTGDDIVPNEVYSFPASCPGCMRHCVTRMKMVDIPHFQQVVIMSTVCDDCGYRSNEVKTGGEIPEKGKKITLQVEKPEDLTRDILKSESCSLECPELDLSVNPGTLGGRFTTVEGLLAQVRDDLHQQIFDFDNDEAGDSLPSDDKANWENFFEGIDAAIKGERKFRVILTDPLGSSYIQNFCSPNDDPQIMTEVYDRTLQDEDELGLRDMKTEGYAIDESDGGKLVGSSGQ